MTEGRSFYVLIILTGSMIIITRVEGFMFPIEWDNSSSNIVNSSPIRKQLIINIEDVIEDEEGSRYIISLSDPFGDMEEDDFPKNVKTIKWDNSSSNDENIGQSQKLLIINIEDVIEDEEDTRFVISLSNFPE